MIPVLTLLELRKDYDRRCQEIKDGDSYPFYSWCCKNVKGYKTMRGNLAFRKSILERAANDLDFKNDVYAMCSRDILFWINTFCIAAGTRVVTDRGLIAIEDVLPSDLVWDGESWVSQKGVLHKGRKSVIMAYGIKLTPDHKVRTTHGWKQAVQGYDREEIRMPDGYSEKWSIPQNDTGGVAGSVRMRERVDGRREQLTSGPDCELRMQKRGKADYSRSEQRPSLCNMDVDESKMPKSKQHIVLPLRGEGHTNKPSLEEVRELSERHGETAGGTDIGENRQQRELHGIELQVGFQKRTGEQYETECENRNIPRLTVNTGSGEDSGGVLQNDAKATSTGPIGRPTSSAEIQQTAEVYDLVNCGTKHAFTVIGDDGRPLLVHNCFTYDPRLDKEKTIPFITYDFQDVALDKVVTAEGDLYAEKSRDMGASWIFLADAGWEWQFHHGYSALLGSRDEKYVDKSGDRKSLFWKIDSLLENQPKWLQPNFRRIYLHFENYDTGSTIEGESTTGDFGRGGRWTRIMLDEFAAVEPDGAKVLKATRDATKRRVFNSTHQGAATSFYRIGLTNIPKLIMHWSIHPEKNKGLYYAVDGKVKRLDDYVDLVMVDGKEYSYPDDYAYILDGKLRSPWYDHECARAEHPMEIAQELDIDPFSSDFQYFDPNMIAEIEKENVCQPFAEGMLEFDEDSLDPLGFVEGKNGPLKLWVYPDYQNKIDRNLEIGVGADISAGTGASNSTATFVNLRTGEKIASYADPWIKPESYARLIIALCKFFNDAFLVPDGAGPGRTFCDELIRLGYRNLYYRRNEEGLNKKVSDKPGVFLNPKEKAAVMGLYRRSLKEKTFIQRCHDANQECLEYIYTLGNKIEHSSAVNSIDPSGAGDSHGDRVVSDALAAKCIDFLGKKKDAKTGEGEIPPNCYAARVRERERKARHQNDW